MNRPTRSRFIHVVDIYLADTEQTDSTGSLTPGEAATATGITCLVNDKGGNRFVGYGRELERKKIRVAFPDPIELRQGHFIRYVKPNGIVRWFMVDSFRDDEDMGRLWVAECSEAPDPITSEISN